MHRLVCALLLIATTAFSQSSTNEQAQIWGLEKSYWEYVKANDLEKYRSLWHEQFVGWPSVSDSPVRKDHITDWITANTSKGVSLKSYELEQLANQITGDIAITHYRIKMNWTESQTSHTSTQVIRITHTWLRNNGAWQIIGGMSCPVNAEAK